MANFEIDGLVFAELDPHDLTERRGGWHEIQHARMEHYKQVFEGPRTELQVANFVFSEKIEYWNNPQRAVGHTAIRGQLRIAPRVIAAFDERTNKLKGFARGAVNVSSLRKPEIAASVERFAKLHVPLKRFRAKRYLWGSEVVNPEGRNGLEVVLTGLFLETTKPDLPGSWYPYAEEVELRELLAKAGYKPDRETRGPKEGEIATTDQERFGFPPEVKPAKQERWQVPHVGIAISNLFALPDAAVAFVHAHEATVPKN